MVGCENDACPYEWFHYACVGLRDPPQSTKWYCPTCREAHERKSGRRSGKLR